MLSVHVAVIGPGLVGCAFIRQLQAQISSLALADLLGASIKLVTVANSKHMVTCPAGFASDEWRGRLLDEVGSQALSLQDVASSLDEGNAGYAGGCNIVVDCTASDTVPDAYSTFARSGIHIVTPNKKFGAGPLERVNALTKECKTTGSLFMCEATVGAGLPIISSLRSLMETGDRIIKIEGVMSGTLSYIFNSYRGGMRFSDVVADAKHKGYTEPDPREDLSGLDVARKVVILARACGLPIEMSSLSIESLVPSPLAALATGEVYMQQLPKFDDEMGRRAAAAEAKGQLIRYIGRVDVQAGTASVEVASVDTEHPFANLSGTDNMVAFTTERYKDRPLVVRGPGAGAEVTAAGIFSDLIQIVRCHKVRR